MLGGLEIIRPARAAQRGKSLRGRLKYGKRRPRGRLFHLPRLCIARRAHRQNPPRIAVERMARLHSTRGRPCGPRRPPQGTELHFRPHRTRRRSRITEMQALSEVTRRLAKRRQMRKLSFSREMPVATVRGGWRHRLGDAAATWAFALVVLHKSDASTSTVARGRGCCIFT